VTLSNVNGALAMCLHKIQAKKSRTQPANTPASMNQFFRSLGIKFSGLIKNRWSSKQYRMKRKFLFMRCICIGLGKVTGEWIWLQTIIKMWR
jgi:hypothetical protein